LISSKEDIEACRLEQNQIAEIAEKTSLVLDSLRKREQDIQAAPEEEKARLRADPRTRELEASLQESLLDIGRRQREADEGSQRYRAKRQKRCRSYSF
jgi:hypothetical protein